MVWLLQRAILAVKRVQSQFNLIILKNNDFYTPYTQLQLANLPAASPTSTSLFDLLSGIFQMAAPKSKVQIISIFMPISLITFLLRFLLLVRK